MHIYKRLYSLVTGITRLYACHMCKYTKTNIVYWERRHLYIVTYTICTHTHTHTHAHTHTQLSMEHDLSVTSR